MNFTIKAYGTAVIGTSTIPKHKHYGQKCIHPANQMHTDADNHI